jgi:hypothetical protein
MYFSRNLHLLSITVLFLAGPFWSGLGQDVDYDEMLQRIDTIENPVYKPVLSMGYGVLNFYGDIRSSNRLPAIGNPALRMNVTTFIDNSQHFAANFYFLTGSLTGEQRSTTNMSKNLNFKSQVFSIGASARYEFGHLFSDGLKFRPYVSIGLEQLNFNSKGDLFDGNGQRYYYWPDGSIRDLPDTEPGAARPLVRDYVYETDLRSFERNVRSRETGNDDLGSYSLRSLGIPVEIGFVMRVSQRVYVSLGTEYHYTFSDYIDNVASEGTYIPGNKANDGFLFTHATLHFDMFSDPKTKTVDLLYADLETDPLLFDDEDGDFVLDMADQCPGTPYGVVVDTLGCPLDRDNDGVPDYLDKEPDSEPGVWVDEEGVTLSEDDLTDLLQRDDALKREDLDAYLAVIEARYNELSVTEIPEKFTQIDTDEDGYVSFEELLRVIDDYFDFNVDLSLDELRQVNDFFFSQ